jgi:hypothetical protein
MITTEEKRLQDARERNVPWRRWGPYLSERQWGTVREDYSQSGNAWDYFSHDQARSRAYRWGEDGLAGISDDRQRLCVALALWNGKDPILKERLFGLTNSEGNHGEDVKEYYFYLDSTPTHSYMKYLFKYQQARYPYEDVVITNRRRSRLELEYELIDSGVFDEGRYFDAFGEYAKDGPEDMLMRVSAFNRGPEGASLHILPMIWFRNTWSWTATASSRPALKQHLACKFFEHFVYLAGAMDRVGIHNDELWDEEDGFFYDVLRLPGGDAMRVKVRSMVGLIPLFASAVLSPEALERLPGFRKRLDYFIRLNAPLMARICNPSARRAWAGACCCHR